MHSSLLVFAAVSLAAGTALAAPPVRYKCPTEKPQKVYGHAMNAKAVLEKDETWTPDNVYLVFGHFSLQKTLTIQPGTVVCFDYDQTKPMNPPAGQLNVEQGGMLKVMGTKDKHVVFTSRGWSARDDGQQYWGGIYYASGSRTDEGTVQYLDIYNSGLSAAGGALDSFPDPKQPPIDWQHVTLYSIQRVGLKNLTGGFTPETRIVINNYAAETPKRDLYNGYPVLRMHLFGAKTITADTIKVADAVQKSVRYIQLDHAEGMHIDADVTLHKLSHDLAWRNIGNMKMNGYEDDPPTFLLDPGVTVAVNEGGYIRIGDGGSGFANIVAKGTKDDPITFTSDAFTRGAEPDAGDWSGIIFSPGNFCPSSPKCKPKSKKSEFDWVVFEYGGALGKDTIYNCNDGRSDRGAVIVFNIASHGQDFEGPVIKNSVWRNARGAGVRSRCNVGHSGGCLLTNYEDPKLNNKFEGFDAANDRPATTPLTCPAN